MSTRKELQLRVEELLASEAQLIARINQAGEALLTLADTLVDASLAAHGGVPVLYIQQARDQVYDLMDLLPMAPADAPDQRGATYVPTDDYTDVIWRGRAPGTLGALHALSLIEAAKKAREDK